MAPKMAIERLMIEGQAPPFSHYCDVVRAGDHVWLSGMVGITADGDVPEDTVAQFEIAMASIDKGLRQAGGRPDQIVKVQIFMTDVAERGRINPIRQAYFGDHRPASTLVEVSALVDPRLKVEIEAVAYLGA